MRILKNESLKKHTNYQIGGKAKYFIEVDSVEDLIKAIKFTKENGNFFILGGGTNVLFGDNGLDETIIKIAIKEIKKEGCAIIASSGVLVSDLIDFSLKSGFSGLEWAGGLPGTIGGAIYGNAGAFGGEMKDSIFNVKSLAFEGDKPIFKNRNYKECLFGYWDSVFKHNGEIILGATFKFENKDKKEIEKEINRHIAYRKEHQPLEYPSAGSTFKNIPLDSVSQEVAEEFKAVVKNDQFPVIPVAAVLDKLGLKGRELGGAQISEKHPNFFINKNNACFGDVFGLINLAKEKTFEKYGIVLKEEIEIIN
jgi:UDP-N-acetylmuramate dehydrogenase